MLAKKAGGKQMAANQEHIDILKQGVEIWNQWRVEHHDIQPDLSIAILRKADLRKADLRGANLSTANLSGANLKGANLSRAILYQTKLSKADLREAFLSTTILRRADLRKADLRGADLRGADLNGADLSAADLSAANLNGAILVDTNLSGATLIGCSIYGISAWNVGLEGAKQENLVITDYDEPTITVDNLKIAQFIYLLLNNAEIREVIDTIAKKAVLILGRFTPERKTVLDTLREALRTHGYLPILFDFDKPSSRSFTETVRTLAHLARFIIADLTDPSSIPQELQAIIPTLAVPVQPILFKGKKEYAMFVDFSRFSWVLPVYFYQDQTSLLASLNERVIAPAEQKAKELEKR